jgi:hypothetical protein
MKEKYIWILSSIIVLILLFNINNQTEGFGGEQLLKPVKDHQLIIKKIGDEWKVVLADDSTKTKVKAKKKDKITWRAEGTDVFFQFMSEDLFGKFKDKSKNKKLTLTITENAELGVHKYAVFCLADSQFATGGSPPEIDIGD